MQLHSKDVRDDISDVRVHVPRKTYCACIQKRQDKGVYRAHTLEEA